MTNGQLWETVKEYSQDASQVARHLGFAAAGLLWATKDATQGWSAVSKVGLVFVVAYFFFDLTQYVFAAARLRCWIRGEEIKMYGETGSIEGEYQVPPSLDAPVYVIWLVKLSLLAASFVFAALAIML